MRAGFDYGTSNCAIGTIKDGQSQLFTLNQSGDKSSPYLPSLVYAESRESIIEQVSQRISDEQLRANFQQSRLPLLRLAAQFRQENGITANEKIVHYGHSAMAEYQLNPSEGFFAKSPKSFLGATGLSQQHLNFFEDVVTAMMLEVNQQVSQQSNKPIEDIVIGRPVNFASLDTDAGNRQAIDILTTAAQRAGYRNIEFLYEPLGAGLAFEQELTNNKKVLVLDIGGGTSDCSVMLMGPDFKTKTDRSKDFLAHTGIRIGGNDLDISLAGKAIMPLLGMGTATRDGLPLPAKYFSNAVQINDVNAQSQFYSDKTRREINALPRQAVAIDKVSRLVTLLNEQKNFAVVKTCEQAKIDLSHAERCVADLDYLEESLETPITRELFAEAINTPLNKIIQLLKDTVQQAGSQPDLVFITGGSGQSPVVRAAVQQELGDIPLVDGDHFGSVVTGLTHWAERIYR